MKTLSILAALTLGSAVALLACYASFDLTQICRGVGGLFACGVVGLALSDYSRKPRFGSSRKRPTVIPAASSAPSPSVTRACDWTHSTISA
jgi:hypothetical protein